MKKLELREIVKEEVMKILTEQRFKVGDHVKVDMNKVRRSGEPFHWIKLVAQSVKNGGKEGVEILSIRNYKAEIMGSLADKFLGGPWVPLDYLTKIR